MAIKLYHDVPSTNCDRVKIVLAEKGLAWESIWVKLGKMEQKSPEHLQRNPYGKIPVIDDDGKLLFESCIINEYLDEKYPNPPLMPKDPAKRAKARILIDYGMGHFDAPYQRLRMELIKDAKEQNQQVIATAKAELKKLLQRLEDEIGEQQFLLGDFSLVDADLLPRFTRLEGFGVLPDPSLPRLGKYLERVKARPSVRPIL